MGARMLRGWLLRPLADPARIGARQRHRRPSWRPTGRAARGAGGRAGGDAPTWSGWPGGLAARRATVDDLRALAATAAGLPALARATAGARDPLPAGAGRARGRRWPPSPSGPPRRWPRRGDGGPLRPAASPALAAARGAAGGGGRLAGRLRRGAAPPAGPGHGQAGAHEHAGPVPGGPGQHARPGRLGAPRRACRRSSATPRPSWRRTPPSWPTPRRLAAEETRALLADLREAAAAAAARGARPGPPPGRGRRAALAGGWWRPSAGGCRPEVGPPSADLEIVAGRAPGGGGRRAVPAERRPPGRRAATRDQLVVLTGPNMAGKSTWMRQVALIVAAGPDRARSCRRRGRGSGWWTPSSRASARWTTWPAGARPSWWRWWRRPRCCAGRPTAAWCCWTSSGAGTSTHDGMAIAWAVIEHLATGPVRPARDRRDALPRAGGAAGGLPAGDAAAGGGRGAAGRRALPAPHRAGRGRPQLRHRGGAAGRAAAGGAGPGAGGGGGGRAAQRRHRRAAGRRPGLAPATGLAAAATARTGRHAPAGVAPSRPSRERG